MKTNIKLWTIKRLYASKDTINPKPPFQRGPVWSERQRSLLIDSILRGYDIPKIYLNDLRQLKLPHAFQFEVADGQQRLKAIFDFLSDKLTLSDLPNGDKIESLAGKTFSTLSPKAKKTLLGYKATIAELTGYTAAELRALFARLQMGLILTPPELRNAIASVIGSLIEVTAVTHKFFDIAKIPSKRFKRQDYLSHVISLITYKNKQDLKAPLLKQLYEDFSTELSDCPIEATHEILDLFLLMPAPAIYHLRKKWIFVDVFWLFYQCRSEMPSNPLEAIKSFSEKFSTFENSRKANNKTPEAILHIDPKLYNYIVAFKTSPATKTNLEKRRDVMRSKFASTLISQ